MRRILRFRFFRQTLIYSMKPNPHSSVTELAHTILNQLGLITGNAGILKMSPHLSDRDQQHLARITEAALKAGEAVRELVHASGSTSRGQ